MNPYLLRTFSLVSDLNVLLKSRRFSSHLYFMMLLGFDEVFTSVTIQIMGVMSYDLNLKSTDVTKTHTPLHYRRNLLRQALDRSSKLIYVSCP